MKKLFTGIAALVIIIIGGFGYFITTGAGAYSVGQLYSSLDNPTAATSWFQKAATKGYPIGPGYDLLYAIKAVTDSGRVDDPAAVSAMLHLSFTNSGYTEAVPDFCKPGARWKRNVYKVTGNNWFLPLPTGKQYLLFPSGYAGNKEKLTLRDPTVEYSTLNVEDCDKKFSGQSSGYIDFENIPAYACIDEAEIKTVFPSSGPPAIPPWHPGMTAPMPEGDFELVNRVTDGVLLFDVMPTVNGTYQPNILASNRLAIPGCLIDMHLLVNHPMGPLNKPHFGN